MKFIISIIGLISSLVLTSCASGGSEIYLIAQHESEQVLRNIIDALEKRDREAIKELFSKSVIENTDLELGIDYLFNYIPNQEIYFDSVSGDSEEMGGRHTSSSVHDGKRITRIEDEYRITVGGEPYIIFFVFYPIDELVPDNQGIHSLRITRESYIVEHYTDVTQFGEGADAEKVELTSYGDCLNQMEEGIFVPDGSQTNFLGVSITE